MMRLLALIIFTAFILSGCGGGSSSEETPVNLKVTSIKEPADDANAGHGIDLEYIISSDAIKNNVVINFYIVNNTQFQSQDDDEAVPQSEQYYLGTDDIATVHVGENHRSVEFLIPDDISTEGEYFIIADVDPDNMISETNEDDNYFYSYDSKGRAASALMDISTDYIDTTNLVLKELVLDEAVIILDQSDLTALHPSTVDLTQEFPVHGNTHLNGHFTLQIEGKMPTQQQLEQIKIKAQAKINGVWVDLYYWNYDNERYADYVTLQVLEKEETTLEEDYEEHPSMEEHTLHFEVNIPAAAATAMLNEIVADVNASLLEHYNKFDVRVVVDTDNSVAELDETDNSFEVPITVYSFPNMARSGSDYLLEKSYRKGVGNKRKVRIELNMYAKNGLETDTKYGAIMKNEISMPAYAFRKSRNIFAIRDQHSAYVNDLSQTGYMQEIELMGFTVYGEEQWADHITISYEKMWGKEDPIAYVDFFVGPVPLTMETGIDGGFGVYLSATLSARDDEPILSSDNNLPQMDFDLYASAGVGNSSFSAGPIAALVMIKEILNFYNYATLDYDENLDKLNSGSIGMKITNDMESIRGKFGVYVRYRTIKWCKKWGIPYPCGTKKKKKTRYYYRTKALYDKTYQLYKSDKTWNF